MRNTMGSNPAPRIFVKRTIRTRSVKNERFTVINSNYFVTHFIFSFIFFINAFVPALGFEIIAIYNDLNDLAVKN